MILFGFSMVYIEIWLEETDKFETFGNQILEAAKENFDEFPKQQKQPYISKETWELMEKRDDVFKQGETSEAEALNKEIKWRVKKEKTDFKVKQLEEIDKQGYKWEGQIFF